MTNVKIMLWSENEARRFKNWLESLKDKSIKIKSSAKIGNYIRIEYEELKNVSR